MTRLHHEQVAKELQRRLYAEIGEPDWIDDEERYEWSAFIKLTYEQLRDLSGYRRELPPKCFYADVERYGWEIGIVIGFGNYVVTIATDTSPTSERSSS